MTEPMEMAMEPCPHCAHESKLDKQQYTHPPKHWVKCTYCGASSDAYSSPQSAIAAWNQRAPSSIDTTGWREPTTSTEFHQRRGMMADAILAALFEYDEFMKDDDYDYRNALEGVIAPLMRVREVAKQVSP